MKITQKAVTACEAHAVLAPYYQYADAKDNHSITHNKSQYVYQKCVACNTKRFSIAEMQLEEKIFRSCIHCTKCEKKIHDLLCNLSKNDYDVYWTVDRQFLEKVVFKSNL